MSEQGQVSQWAILPAMVRYDQDIPANAKLIYAEIAAKINARGYCFSHNRYFAERFGIKEDTVSSLIKKLENAGYIVIAVDPSQRNALRRQIFLTAKPYDFISSIGFKSDTESDLNPGPIENINIKINPPKSPKRERAREEPRKEPEWMPERFNAFWLAYPRGEKKQMAMVAWDKLHADEGLLNLMALGLKRQLDSEEWKRGIGIPYASTWLNQRRWEDEVKALPQQTAGDGYWAADPEVM